MSFLIDLTHRTSQRKLYERSTWTQALNTPGRQHSPGLAFQSTSGRQVRVKGYTPSQTKVQSCGHHMLPLRAHDAGFKLTSSAHRSRAPTPTSPGANWLWRPLPPDSRLERSRSLCRLASVPTGLEISGLFADWPQCPLAWRPRAAPGHDRAWFHPRCSLGLDTSRRKSTRRSKTTFCITFA